MTDKAGAEPISSGFQQDNPARTVIGEYPRFQPEIICSLLSEGRNIFCNCELHLTNSPTKGLLTVLCIPDASLGHVGKVEG